MIDKILGKQKRTVPKKTGEALPETVPLIKNPPNKFGGFFIKVFSVLYSS